MCVDALSIAATDPNEITDVLMKKYNFKLKGTGPIKYHFGCDFFIDEFGVFCFFSKKYIENMVEGYQTMIGSKPRKNVSLSLEKGNHPE